MRWILGIVLFITCLAGISQGINLPRVVHSPSSEEQQTCGKEASLNSFQFDFSELIHAEARVRSNNNPYQRLKSERAVGLLPSPGLEFLSCKLIRSYSENFIDLYLKRIFQQAIQVNAP